MIRLLHHCIENDITSFDSTDKDGNPVARTFGTALSESGLSRDKIQLIGKLKNSAGANLVDGVDELLLNLRTDYLDLLLLENPNQPNEVKNDLEKLSSRGKIVEIGGFNLQESGIETFRKNFPLSANYSEMNFSASEENKEFQVFEKSPEELVQMIGCNFEEASLASQKNILDELSRKYKVNKTQLLLSWLLDHPSHLHPVISFTSEEEISSAVAAKETSLNPVDWQKINFLLK